MTKIAIIGSGVVGTATGKGLHKLGHRIIFNDISSQRLLALEKEGYKVTTSIKEAISKTNISFICVNTPVCVKKIKYYLMQHGFNEWCSEKQDKRFSCYL